MSTITELQAKMAAAIANNDVKAIEEIAMEIVKGKADRRKSEAEALKKEAEELAGVREKLAGELVKVMHQVKGLNKMLEDVKVWSFTYTRRGQPDVNGVEVTNDRVSLAIPQAPKSKKSGGGGGNTGKTKDEFGMSLDEVYNKFANEEERGRFASAEAVDVKFATEHGLTSPKQSNRWRIKNEVKKRALKEGLLAPTK